MIYETIGCLKKMRVNQHIPVEYTLCLNDQHIPMNTLLGRKIALTYTGQIYCTQCGRKTNKSFQQGYCFPCYRRLLECHLCTIYPEKCAYYEGKCDPNDWAHANCGQPHIIYLANSSGLKVGITRTSQIPTRWIDQGATQGLPIFNVKNRYQSGLVEVALKKYIADKTNWRAMLCSGGIPQDLLAKREEVLKQIKDGVDELNKKFNGDIQPLPDAALTEITYPILQYPEKIQVFNLDKDKSVEGILQGIKGQYLLLDTGVINIRKFTGYEVMLHGE
ncbi:MAG: hypothetical protein K0Q74_1073 [Gammaproteobacteria bacterium]|jgi:hypothetical protein|nr:hypothetical protein [Gammaproteobacteria bacterium]